MSRRKESHAGRSLRAWRKAQRLSQAAAGRRFGMTQQAWGRIENGQRRPRPPVAARIVRGTGVSLETLLGITL